MSRAVTIFLALLFAFMLLVGAGAVGLAVAEEVDEADAEDEEGADDNPPSYLDDSVSVEDDVDSVLLYVSPTVDVYDAEYHDDGTVDVYVDVSVPQRIQINEERNDGGWVESHYQVDEGQTKLVFTPQYGNTDSLAIRSGHDREGNDLVSPTASPITFERGPKWTDFYFAIPLAVFGVFGAVIYRFKRREFFARTELRSMVSGRVYRSNDPDASRYTKVKKKLLRHFYTPRSLLVAAIGLLLVEIATESVFTRIAEMQTELQLAVLIIVLGIPLYYWTAGKILNLIPIADQPKMLTLDNREFGGFDVVTGAKELFDEMRIKGAKKLSRRPVTGTKEEAYVAHHYDVVEHTAVATWEMILDPLEVARNWTAAFTNQYLLENRIDEANEELVSRSAMRDKFKSEGIKTAQRKMDEVHFAGERSTNDLRADVMSTVEHDEKPETVDTADLDKGDSDSDSSEGGDDE